ncbi:MAG: alpha/beta hydrolase [Candidatus Omnitrophica bacterium]|jgi:pimeloyl-ACP methyl ester carboxylesterase|nr:alpha/beta hydrolase [Candidatus Omnitrophota bacterium]
MITVLLSAAASVVVLILVGAVMIFRYIPVIERNAFEVPRIQVPADLRPPSSLKIRNFQIPFNTRNAIQAQYVKARQPGRKLVVFCHETGADLNSWYKHGSFLPDDGIDVLTFNFKPVALSAGAAPKDELYQWPSTRDLRCLESVLSWVAVHKRNYDVILFGVSKGATIAAAGAPSPFVKAVLLDGAFSTHLTLQKYMKKWVNIYVSPRAIADNVPDWVYYILSYATLFYASARKHMKFFSVEKFISKLKKPVFWIHAGKDYHVRLEHVEKLRRLIPGITDLWVAEQAGHSQAVLSYPDEYHSRIVGFINKNIDQTIALQ